MAAGDSVAFDDPDRVPARRRGLAIAIGVALVAAIAVQLVRERDTLTNLPRLPPALMVSAVAFQLAAQLFWNAAMWLPLKAHMNQLGFWQLFMVRSGASVAGLALPIANLAVRMAYLKRRGLGYGEFAWATAVSNLLALVSGGVVATGALALLWARSGVPPPAIILTAVALGLGMAGMSLLHAAPRLADRPGLRRWSWLTRATAPAATDVPTARTLAYLILRHMFNFLTFGLLFQALSNPPVEFLAGGLIYAITSPVRIVTITPANIGINEWAVAAVGRALAVDVTVGLVVALVFRVVSVVAQAVGVLVGGLWMAVRDRPSADRASP